MYHADYRFAKALMDANLGEGLRSVRQLASSGLPQWLADQKTHWFHHAGLRLVTLGENLHRVDNQSPICGAEGGQSEEGTMPASARARRERVSDPTLLMGGHPHL